jgi:HSP20 family molecular chaperone IbpA
MFIKGIDFGHGTADWAREYERPVKPVRKDVKTVGQAMDELLGWNPSWNNVSAVSVKSDEILDSEGHWQITVPVAGMKKEDFALTRKANKLTLSVRDTVNALDTKWLAKKSWTWTLNKDVEDDGISAECKDGVMTITIEKPEQMNPTEASISIN